MSAAALQPRRPALARWSWIPFVVGCQLVGILGAVLTDTGTSAWYQSLSKPAFQPPAWVFGPVWTLLYALMGIAAWRIWRHPVDNPLRRMALGLFGLQLLLNGIWTPVFFGAHAMGWALLILAVLWLAIAATMLVFRGIDRAASRMLVPYLAWVSFALVLNDALWRLN